MLIADPNVGMMGASDGGGGSPGSTMKDILIVGSDVSPFLCGYDTDDGTQTETTIVPNAVKGVAFSPISDILAVAHYPGVPVGVMSVYNTTDWSRITISSGVPSSGGGDGVAFSPNGAILALAHYGSPYLSLFNTSNWSQISNPPSLPTGNGIRVAFSTTGAILLLLVETSPYVVRYNTSTWGKYGNLSTPPPGYSYCVAFSPNGSFCAIGHAGSPRFSIYNISDWQKIANPVSLPASDVLCVTFSPDSSLCVVGHEASPYITIYNTSDWSKRANPSVLPGSTALGVSFNEDGSELAVALYASPFVVRYNTADWSKIPNVSVPPLGKANCVAFGQGAVSGAAWDVSTAVYSGKSFSVSAWEGYPKSIFIRPDGAKMYVVGNMNNTVYQYTLSTAWDVSTAVYGNRSKLVSAQDAIPRCVIFNPSGTVMYIGGVVGKALYQYTLSTAWDVSTATYANKSVVVSALDGTPSEFFFKPDGTSLYFIGNANKTVFQYTLSTAWDVSTATYANKSKSVTAQETNPFGLFFSPSGVDMYVIGLNGDTIFQYTLSTAWDVSTATYSNKSKNVNAQDASPFALFFKATGSTMYVLGTQNINIYQYDLE